MRTTVLSIMLRRHRLISGLTVRQLAPVVKVSPATLSRIERGGKMDLDTWMTVQAWLFSKLS